MKLRDAWSATLLAGALILSGPVDESNLEEADSAPFADSAISLVYGSDDRREIEQVNHAVVKRVASRVVMLADASAVTPVTNKHFELSSVGYGESLGLCRSEPFWKQPRVGFCTGFLVRPNLILTAGHCVLTEKDCHNTRIIFDFRYSNSGDLDLTIPAHQVRQCKKIVTRFNRNSGLDMALLELDQKVTDREPLTIGIGKRRPHQVFMVGHPMGLPAKFSGLAQVLRETKLEWITDLDSSAGNSGSPVFDYPSGALLGILTAGEDGDFGPQQHQCQTSKNCHKEDCFGEVVLKIDSILEHAQF